MRVTTLDRRQAITAAMLAARDVDDRTARAAALLHQALSVLGSTGAFHEMHVPVPQDRLLRLPEVQHLTGLCRSAIYQRMKEGVFPRSVKVGPRAATWSETAVQAWIHQRFS